MSAVLAVDGGQSGVRVRSSATAEIVELEGVSRQEGDIVVAVADEVVAGWVRLGRPDVQRVVLGLTTAPTDDDGMRRLAELVASPLDATEVLLCDDTVTAHAGALAGGWGVSLRAGTGVACLAVGEPGDALPSVVDGHGYLLGDDGAGYWIGREGLRAVLRSVDGRGPTTALRRAAEQHFGDLGQLHIRVHDLPRPVHAIAAFAPVVLAAAEHGDAAAQAIASAAADQLAATAATAADRIAAASTVPIALGGRLLEQSPMLRRRVAATLAVLLPSALVRDAAGDPLTGALGLGTGEYPDRYHDSIHHWHASHDPRRATIR